MKLFVDATDRSKVWVGLEYGGKRDAIRFPALPDEGAGLLASIDQLLRANGAAAASCTHLYAVIGPGRFTGLRVAAVIANCWAFVQQPVRLFAVPAPPASLRSSEERFSWCLTHGRRRTVLRPLYGKQPNITAPKARPWIF